VVFLSRAALASVAIASLAGAANAAPSNFRAGAAPMQALTPPRQPVGAANSSRVVYVANIDGQPGLGQILVYSASMQNPQLLRTITNGAGRPFGLWVDAKNILYVANYPNKLQGSVTEFQPGASSPFFEITSFMGYPESVAVDAKGDVFVNESYEDEGIVQEFAPGSNTAERTIDTGVGGYAFGNGGMAFDGHGNLIVAEQADLKLQIVKIARGSFKVSSLGLDLNGNDITGPGMGIDKAGNIYVGSGATSAVYVFAPGQTEPSRTISNVAGYGFMNVTPQGAVYEASGESSVAEIAPGANAPTHILGCFCSAQGAAASR